MTWALTQGRRSPVTVRAGRSTKKHAVQSASVRVRWLAAFDLRYAAVSRSTVTAVQPARRLPSTPTLVLPVAVVVPILPRVKFSLSLIGRSQLDRRAPVPAPREARQQGFPLLPVKINATVAVSTTKRVLVIVAVFSTVSQSVPAARPAAWGRHEMACKDIGLSSRLCDRSEPRSSKNCDDLLPCLAPKRL